MHQHSPSNESQPSGGSARGTAERTARSGGLRPNRRRIHLVAVLAGVAAGALLLSACSSSSSPSSSGQGSQGISVEYASHVIAPNLDPDLAYSGNTLLFVRNVYEGLLSYVPGSTKLRPALATSYSTSSDGLTYTFTLRKGVKFHDGTSFDANAVVTSLNRLKAINQGPASFLSGVSGWQAVGSDTVTITLSQPDTYFPGDLPWLPIVSPAAITAHKTAKDQWAQTWFANHEDGTGPYKLTTFTVNSNIGLAAFDGYWQKWPNDVPTKVSITQVTDVSTVEQLIKSGQADFTDTVDPTTLSTMAKDANVAISTDPGYTLRTIFLNTAAKGPTSNPQFRKAMILAFPYAAYFKYYQGWGQSTNGPIPVGMAAYDKSLPNFAQDLAQAKQILQTGGWLNSGVQLTYASVEGDAYEQYAGTLLQSTLASFGIKLITKTMPWPQIPPLMAKASSAFDMAFLNIGANTNNPVSLMDQAYSSKNVAAKGGYNWANVSSPIIDSQISKIAGANPATAESTLKSLTQNVLATYSSIFCIAPQNAHPVTKEWANVKFDALSDLNVLEFFDAHRS
jgi:peptide/nickel transport system substrate-binding protein